MPDQPADLDSQPSPPAPSAAPPEEMIAIGGITLPAALFDIASVEARQSAAALRQQFDELLTGQVALVQYDFMRAAHTLAGVNRTMGFAAVAELAYALDGWLQAHIDREAVLDAPRLALLEQTVAALEAMAQSICDKQMPQPRVNLVKQLIAGKDKLAGEIAMTQIPRSERPVTGVAGISVKAEKPQIQDDAD